MARSESKTNPLPVFVLTGFLGSGKTTLLSGLLGHSEMENTCVIVNELGEIGLDHFLVEATDEDVVLLNAGCLCCTISNTLADTLVDLYLRRVKGTIPRFERVIVETTGLADPATIVHTLTTSTLLAGGYRLDGVITTVDAVFGEGQLDQYSEVVKQVAIADRVVLTKADMADRAMVTRLSERLRRLNPAAPVIEVSNGVIGDPGTLVGAALFSVKDKSPDVGSWLREDAFAGDAIDRHGRDVEDRSGGDGDPGRGRHDHRIRSFSAYLDFPISWAGYAAWVELMKQFNGPRLLRVKGLLNIAESPKPVVIHAVQHVFYRPVTLDRWPTDDHRSRLVLTTYDLDETLIGKTFEAFRTAAGRRYAKSLESVLE